MSARAPGHALIGARQWIPADQITDPVRSLQMALPLDVQFATKGQLAKAIVAGALADGVHADFVYGDDTAPAPSCGTTWKNRTRPTCGMSGSAGRARAMRSTPCARPVSCRLTHYKRATHLRLSNSRPARQCRSAGVASDALVSLDLAAGVEDRRILSCRNAARAMGTQPLSQRWAMRCGVSVE
jgi:hypothetical protein